MRPDDPRRLGVAVTTYRRPAELARCLDAVAGLGDLVHAVCVVDDDPSASPSPRPDGLARGTGFAALVQPVHSGLPGALTRAFEVLSACDEILVLDDDTVVDRTVVDALRAAMAPGVAVASVPTEYDRRYGTDPAPALFAWSPSLVRRAALDAVGPPEGALFFGYDDWDLALRLRDAAWRIAWVPHDLPRRSAPVPWPERRYFAVRNAVWLATRRRRHRRRFGRVLAADLVATVRAVAAALVSGRLHAARRELAAAVVGAAHGIVGRLGPPPPWVIAGRGEPDARRSGAADPTGTSAPPRTAAWERRARRVVGTTRVAVARVAGRALVRAPDPPGDALRVLADLESFPPATNSGSEWSIAGTLRFLADRGHAVRVLVPPSQCSGPWAGLDVRAADRAAVRAAYAWADVVCSQLGAYNGSARRAARHRKPIVAFVHHGSFDPRDLWGKPDLLVYCASWVAARHPWSGPSIVLHPPIDPDAYRVTRGERVTLVNLSAWKGGALLAALARRMPDHRFLGVRGGWGAQLVPEPCPENLDVAANTPDARTIYARTRVLLHPSADEGYPRVVIEAAASGIPVIAHPAEGTRAALADAAIYVDRDDLEGWVRAVRRLDDPSEYERWSLRARQRLDALDREGELAAFEDALVATARRR